MTSTALGEGTYATVLEVEVVPIATSLLVLVVVVVVVVVDEDAVDVALGVDCCSPGYISFFWLPILIPPLALVVVVVVALVVEGARGACLGAVITIQSGLSIPREGRDR